MRSKTAARFLALSLALALLAAPAACAAGLFPGMDQLFGTAMPSIGLALGRAPDETGEDADGKREVYASFSYDDYAAFGAYLAGVGAVLDSIDATDGSITVTLTVRGASMRFVYDWKAQTAAAFYPQGTRPETEKASVDAKASILPPVGGVMPSAQFAVGRAPDSESTEDGGVTQTWNNFTDEDYNAFSAYLAQAGAALLQSRVEAGVLMAEIGLHANGIKLNYNWHTKTAAVFYPSGTSPERGKWNALSGNGSVLPKLETIGKELPSMSRALSRLPEKKETLADGAYREIYTGFDEDDYEAVSRYLNASGCAVDGYRVEDDRVMVIELSNLTGDFTFTFDPLRHTGSVVYPKGSRIEALWAPTPVPAAATPKPAGSSSGSSSSSRSSFTNKYGTPTTKCAHRGCNNYIASSGDTSCCTVHSHRCLNCGKYIDEDATYCMDCLAGALGF